MDNETLPPPVPEPLPPEQALPPNVVEEGYSFKLYVNYSSIIQGFYEENY